MKFTDSAIKALKPKGARYEIFEGSGAGFGVRVSALGTKTFTLRYRYLGRQRRMTLGPYGSGGITLKEARTRLYGALHKLERGIDPGEELVNGKKQNREAETVGQLANEYLNKHAKVHKKSWQVDERILHKEVIPEWKHRKAKSITRREIRNLIDRITDRGAKTGANRTLEIVRRMFRYGVDHDYLTANPCVGVEKPFKESPRDRVLSEDEIRTFWAKVDEIPSDRGIQLALKLLLITGQRRSEVATIEKKELLESGWWEIPEGKAKNGRAHRVYLNEYAVEIINELLELSGDSDYLIPSYTHEGHVHPNSLTKPIVRYQGTFKFDETFSVHDLRRSFVTCMMSDAKCNAYVGKVVNHAETGVTAKNYDRYDYAKEKQMVMVVWAAKLKAILEGQESNVVQGVF